MCIRNFQSAAAIQEFKDSSTQKQITANSLGQYTSLQRFVKEVAVLCGESDAQITPNEPSAIGLVSFLDGVRDRTWMEIKSHLFE
jgi:hypothetical protein